MTCLLALGPEPIATAYVQPSRRPTDGRYGNNPNRLQHYYQFQVILKPSPHNIQEIYLDSLKQIGLDPTLNDIRFVEDNWENQTLGAWGLGWEVWLNGMEVTQFTYFQQVGGLECQIVAAPRRLAIKVNSINSIPTKSYMEKRGPAINKAFDAEGKPTPAAIGWARQVKFQMELGTLLDKSYRLEILASWIAEIISTDIKQAARAALISKCDLMTQMVFEYPEIQGIIARVNVCELNSDSSFGSDLSRKTLMTVLTIDDHQIQYAGRDITGSDWSVCGHVVRATTMDEADP
ncbi:hypothetical protein J6590_001747 [Homalodisca vitripennis]|nr:hypothetical protein J6590_001747 [Homalodisca vitripennis]